MKRKIKSISRSTKKNFKCSNAYISQVAIVLFLFSIQLVSFVCLSVSKSQALYLAQKENRIEMAIVFEAKKILYHNERIRKCGFDEADLILYQNYETRQGSIEFMDQTTFLDVEYRFEGLSKRVRIYYSGIQIDQIEFEA